MLQQTKHLSDQEGTHTPDKACALDRSRGGARTPAPGAEREPHSHDLAAAAEQPHAEGAGFLPHTQVSTESVIIFGT